MELSPRRPRTPSKLSDSLYNNLNAYALAASAAGVGMLALASPAYAKIIYTPTHHVIHNHNHHYYLDLNHDGKTDFVLGNTTTCDTELCWYVLWVGKTRPGNSVIGYVTSGHEVLASALQKGSRIGRGR